MAANIASALRVFQHVGGVSSVTNIYMCTTESVLADGHNNGRNAMPRSPQANRVEFFISKWLAGNFRRIP